MNSNLWLYLLVIVPLLLILFNGRKQKRQMAEMQQLQSDLNDGDVVMTISGLRATVVDSSYEDTIDLEIAPGVVTTWQRQAVREKVDPNLADAQDDGAKASSDANGKVEDGRVELGGATAARTQDAATEAITATRSETEAPASDRGTV
jgi:preprotein translocase subunit YajC